MSVLAKLTGRVLTVVVRDKSAAEAGALPGMPSADLEDVAGVLLPTFVYIEDNLGGRAEQLMLCGFGAQTDEAQRRFQRGIGRRSGAAAVAAGHARREQRGAAGVFAVHREEQLK